MTRNRQRLPSSRVLRACRCLGGLHNQGDIPNAVRTVLGAVQGEVSLPRSALLDLARIVLDADVDMNRHIRLAAAKALVQFNERVITGRATRAIRDPSSPLDVVMAAATILVGPPCHRLSRPSLVCLVRVIRRFGQVRGPLVDLLKLNKLPPQPSRRAPR